MKSEDPATEKKYKQKFLLQSDSAPSQLIL
jgi:hypothetical protein